MYDFVCIQYQFALFYALWTTKLIAKTSDTAIKIYEQRIKSAGRDERLKQHKGKVTKSSLSQENKVVQAQKVFLIIISIIIYCYYY